MGPLVAIGIILFAVDLDRCRDRSIGNRHLLVFGARHLARRHHILAGTVRLAREVELLVHHGIAVLVDDELTLLRREAVAGFTRRQRVLAAARAGGKWIFGGADAADRLPVRAEDGLVAGIMQLRRTLQAKDF